MTTTVSGTRPKCAAVIRLTVRTGTIPVKIARLNPGASAFWAACVIGLLLGAPLVLPGGIKLWLEHTV